MTGGEGLKELVVDSSCELPVTVADCLLGSIVSSVVGNKVCADDSSVKISVA